MKTKINIMVSGLLLATCLVKAQQGPPPGQKPPSPEEHLKQVTTKLQKDLTLNEQQKAKVEAAYNAFFERMHKLRDNTQPPPPPPPPLPPGKKKSADSLTMIRDAAIKKALTPAQFTKYKQVEKTMRPPGPPGGGPPPQQQAPSK